MTETLFSNDTLKTEESDSIEVINLKTETKKNKT